jgi:Putative Ig domain
MDLKLIKKTGTIIVMAVVLSAAALGTGYAAPVQKNTVAVTPNQAPLSLCAFSWVQSNDDGTTSNHGGFNPIDPGGNSGNDPNAAQSPGVACARASVNVASTTAAATTDTITFNLTNAYPGYHPTIFFGLSNQWPTPGVVSSITFTNPNPSLLTMTLNGISSNQSVNAGAELLGALDIAVGNIPQTGGSVYHLSITIVVTQSGPAFSVNAVSLPNGQLGTAYNQTLGVSNGNSPFTWSVISGALPGGLSLDAATGVITGSPNTAGTFNFTIRVTDITGSTSNISLSITVTAPPAPVEPTTTTPTTTATTTTVTTTTTAVTTTSSAISTTPVTTTTVTPVTTTSTTTPVVTLSQQVTTTASVTLSQQVTTTTSTTPVATATTSTNVTSAFSNWWTSNWWWLVIIAFLLAGLGLFLAFILFRMRRKKLLDFMIKRLTEGATRQQLFESEIRYFIQKNHLPSYSDRDIETMLDWAIKNYPKH